MVIHVVQDQSTILIVAEIAVAVGTIGLAIFTARLAHSTRKDVEAQWRPLLVPCFHNAIKGKVGSDWTGWAALMEAGPFRVAFQNVGKGPALDLRVSVADPPTSTTNFISCGPVRSPVLAVEKWAVFGPEEPTFADNCLRVRVDYVDLAGNPQHTEAVYCRDPERGSEWAVKSVKTKYMKATWWRRLRSKVKP